MRFARLSRSLVPALALAVALAGASLVAACGNATTAGGARALPAHPALPAPAAPETAATAPESAPPADAPRKKTFAEKVRGDYLAGVSGDAESFARAAKTCDDALAVNPDDPEPLVWRGAIGIVEAARAFRGADRDAARATWTSAMSEMDRAVALAPEDPGVRIPRGAALLGVAPFVPEAMAHALYERAVADYRETLGVQRARFATLPLHGREELLFGIADGEAKLGHQDDARAFFQRLLAECPNSSLGPYARAWLSGAKPAERPPCTGCHAG